MRMRSPSGYQLTAATIDDATKRTARELRMARTLLRPAVVDRLPDGTPYGEPEGIVHNPNDLQLHASLLILTKDIGELLVKHYPGFLWMVQPDGRGHVINILIQNFHATLGYTIKVSEIQNDPKRRKAIEAGKTLLAVFRYPTNKYDYATAAALPRDANGQVIPDLSGLPGFKRQKAQAEVDLAMREGRAFDMGIDDQGRKLIQVVH